MTWTLVDHGLSTFVGGADADHNEKTKCPSMKTPNHQQNLH